MYFIRFVKSSDFKVKSIVHRDKKGWTQRVGLANVSPKGLYHVMRG